MKRLLILLFFTTGIISCNRNTSKPKYTKEELKQLYDNPELLAKFKDTALILAGFRKLKLDTTIDKNTNFRMKGWHIDGTIVYSVYDSLLERNYGIKTVYVYNEDYLKKYGIIIPDTILNQKKYGNTYLNISFKFDDISYSLFKKYRQVDIRYEKTYWQEREISYLSSYNWHKKQYPNDKDYLPKDWRKNTIVDLDKCCLQDYCVKKSGDSYDTMYKVIYPKVNNDFKTLVKDTSGLYPIINLYFDTLGNIKNIKTRKPISKERMDVLYTIFSRLNGYRTYKLMDKKYLEFKDYYFPSKR